MSKHTPGPWQAAQPSMGFSALYDADGNLIFGLAAGDDDERQTDDVIDANLRLILAATDLLALLEEIDDYLQPQHRGQINTISTSSLLHKQVQHWIAKAKGGRQ